MTFFPGLQPDKIADLEKGEVETGRREQECQAICPLTKDLSRSAGDPFRYIWTLTLKAWTTPF